jgi:UPF0716 protein FxsA
MPVRILPIIFLVVPILEIAVFILVGQQIGLGWTLILILVTAIIGAYLMRQQGFGVLAQIREDVNAGRVPAQAMAHGVLILMAGLLLLTPGFVTDALGFLLFIPAVRDWVWQVVAPIFFARLSGNWARWPGSYDGGTTYHSVIDLKADEADDPPDPGSRRG